VSEWVLACLVLLFSDKAVTKHLGCQHLPIAAPECCDAKIFHSFDQHDKHQFQVQGGISTMLQSGSPMFSKDDAKKPGGRSSGQFKVAGKWVGCRGLAAEFRPTRLPVIASQSRLYQGGEKQ
jgi:hypothetical protein